jgi:simple sugar transport system ATP-binding protein
LKAITKIFPGLIANDSIDLDLQAGEIHALLGENGAGKSTLMNVLTGIYQPDGGQILVDGRAVRFASAAHAIAAGIGMVHQHFKLIRAMTVAENIHLGWAGTPLRVSAKELEARTHVLAGQFGLDVRPDAIVGDLSAGEQQRVEILRTLARGARVLILDEPTAVLTPGESAVLLRALRDYAAAGAAVVFISHKLDEVLAVADRITVLRGGKRVASHAVGVCNEAMLARLMVGHALAPRAPRAASRTSGRIVLELRGVHARNDRGLPALRSVDLAVHEGEIVAVAGVAGNGQRELTEVLTGMRPPSEGEVRLDGRVMRSADPAAFLAAGMGHIPEDRLRSGLAPSMSVADNAVMREYRRRPLARGPLFSPRAAANLAQGIAADAEVVVPSMRAPVRNLSGGNQQRLVARREMRVATKVLVAAYPTRGLDIGAIDTMLRYIADMRDRGVGVLLVSEDLTEIMQIADRIAVFFSGRVMGVFAAGEVQSEKLGLLMGGQLV